MAETDPDQAEVDFLDFDSFDFDELLGRVLPYSELVGDVSGEICASETAKEEDILSKTPKSPAKNNHTGRKRKTTKVEWTPEMHRRFVKAVEQLGTPEDAMPSKILELMGTAYRLTRHNVANHLQKYRSYRKRLAAREAATATRKPQSYGGEVAAPPNHPRGVPAVEFPPPVPDVHLHRPFNVWGHLTHQSHATTSILNVLATSKLHWGNASPTFDPLNLPSSKESVEAAIDDALSKPWQPFPIGLKPPSIDNVIRELQSHGVPTISPYHV